MASKGSFTKWLQLKIYQVEVTWCVYIFTPLEKFIFCTSSSPPIPLSFPYESFLSTSTNLHPLLTGSIVFLLFSLTALATILYLPHHIMFLVGRAWFYIHGDSALEVAKETAQTLLQHAASTTRMGAAETARAVGHYVADEVASGKVEL